MKIKNVIFKKILFLGILFSPLFYNSALATNINNSDYVVIYVDSTIDNDNDRTTWKIMKINKDGEKEVFESSITSLNQPVAFKKQWDYVYWSYFKIVPTDMYYFKKNINDNYNTPAISITALEFHNIPWTSYWWSNDISIDNYRKTIWWMYWQSIQPYKWSTIKLSNSWFDIYKNWISEHLFWKSREVTWNWFFWVDENLDTLYYKTFDYNEDSSYLQWWWIYNLKTKEKNIYESFDKIEWHLSFDTDLWNSVFCWWEGLKVKEKKWNINNLIIDKWIVSWHWMHWVDKNCLIFTNDIPPIDLPQLPDNWDYTYYNNWIIGLNNDFINNSSNLSNNSQDTVDPVNISNWEFDYLNKLLSLKWLNLNYDLDIKYSNQVYYNWPLWFNFDHNQNIYISKNDDNIIDLHNWLFSISKFNWENSYNLSSRATLSKENELYKIVFDNWKKYYFNDINKISKIEDKNGNALSYYYDADKKLIKTIDTLWKEINYIYNADSRLVKITTSNNDEIDFIYDSNNDLVSIKTWKNWSLKEIKFEYISWNANEKLNHNISKLIDSKLQTYVENTYDESDRVISQKYWNWTVNYTYTSNENWKVIKNNVINRNWVKTEYSFDINWNTISRKVETNNWIVEFKYEYDENGRLTKDINPNWKIIEYSYDSLWRLLIQKEIWEYEKISRYEYEWNFETPIKITKSNGLIIENNLNEKWNVINKKIFNWDEILETSYEYDNLWQLVKTINPNWLKTSLEYQNGNLVKISKKDSSLLAIFSDTIDTSFTYDNAWNILSVTDANWNTKSINYNKFNQIIKTISPEWVINSFEYDLNGNNIKQSEKVDNNDVNVSKTYDILDKISEINNPISKDLNSKTKFEYDNNENIKKITYPNWAVKEFFYNEFDKVIKTIFEWIETKYEYDNAWNITKIIDAKWNSKTLKYDLFNQVTKITDELGNITNLTYDVSWNVIKIEVFNKENKLLSKQEKIYDLLGNTTKEIIYNIESNTQITTNYIYNKWLLVEKIENSGNKTSLNYDIFWRSLSIIDSLWNKQTFEYDKNDNITKKSIISNIWKILNTYYFYDKDNRLIWEKSDNDVLKWYIYNSLNQITRVLDKNWNKTDLEYNYLWKVTKKIQYINWKNIETKFEYDINWNLIAIIDWNWNKTTYVYDLFNRLKKEIYSDTKQINYEYDSLGNVVKKTDPNGNIISNTFDFLNRLVERNISNSTWIIWTIKENYIYDDLWRLINSKSIDNEWKTIETSFVYNSLNQLTSETNNWKTINYEYDFNWNQVKLIYPSWKVVTKSYDEINRLKNINTPHPNPLLRSNFEDSRASTPVSVMLAGEGTKGINIDYNYSWLELVNQINGNTTKTNYSYDNLWRLQELKNISIEELKKWKNTSTQENIINSLTFSYDNIWNIKSNWLENYNYDEISRLISSQIIPPPSGSPFEKGRKEEFVYDNIWNRTSSQLTEEKTVWKSWKKDITNVDYITNELNQYTQTNIEKKNENFVYDNNWNLIQDNKQKYFYDYRNRLVKVEELEIPHPNPLLIGEGIKGKNQKYKNSEIIAKYSYDTLWRRLEKIVYEDDKDKNENKVVKYTYAWNNAIVEEIFEQEKDKLKLEETKENIYSNTIDDILASIITKDWKSKVYYYTKNQLWSITAITDEKGKVVEEYKYDVFGKAYIRDWKSDNWRDFKDSKINNDRLFTGREFDKEIWLYYYRARYYSAELWRFISRDPIGQVDDINLYSYVGNNSVMFVDPMGKEKSLIVWKITIYSWYENPYIFIDWHSWIELTINWETTSYWIWNNWSNSTYAINQNSDIVKNREKDRNYANYDNVVSIWEYINWYQYDTIINTINSDISNWLKWSEFAPCSDFATDIWNTVSDNYLNDGLVSNPDSLATSIESLRNNAKDYYSNINNLSYWQWTYSLPDLYKDLIY